MKKQTNKTLNDSSSRAGNLLFKTIQNFCQINLDLYVFISNFQKMFYEFAGASCKWTAAGAEECFDPLLVFDRGLLSFRSLQLNIPRTATPPAHRTSQ